MTIYDTITDECACACECERDRDIARIAGSAVVAVAGIAAGTALAMTGHPGGFAAMMIFTEGMVFILTP